MSAGALRTFTVGSKDAAPSTKEADARLLAPGTRVGEYLIKRHLADGGMASVYEAVHPVIGKRVAVKVLSGALAWDEAIIQRFVREARAVNEIDHPNIVDIFAFGQLADRRNYLVMELLVGETLAQRMWRGPLGGAEAYETLTQICDALDATHEHHIAHLDLKPENVFLVPARRGPPLVKLLDFGIAELLDPGGAATRANLDHIFRGTPAYASPEQARGLPELDWRSDIYSLGVVAYELLVGRRPFLADTAVAILSKHVTEQPPRPRELGVTLDPEIETLLFEMLAKSPERRPTGAEVRARLSPLRGGPEASIPTVAVDDLGGAHPSSPRHGRRAARGLDWRAAAGLGVLSALTISFLISADWSRSTSSPAHHFLQPQPLAGEPIEPTVASAPSAAPPAVPERVEEPSQASRRSRVRPDRSGVRPVTSMHAKRETAMRMPAREAVSDYLLDYVGQRR